MAAVTGIKRTRDQPVPDTPCFFTTAANELTEYLSSGDLVHVIVSYIAAAEPQTHTPIRLPLTRLAYGDQPDRACVMVMTPLPWCGTPDCRYHYPAKVLITIQHQRSLWLRAVMTYVGEDESTQIMGFAERQTTYVDLGNDASQLLTSTYRRAEFCHRTVRIRVFSMDWRGHRGLTCTRATFEMVSNDLVFIEKRATLFHRIALRNMCQFEYDDDY